jgi:hypothetical protein
MTMKISRVSLILAGAAALLFLMAGGTASAASSNTTAQSIMVFNNDGNGQLELGSQQFVLLGSETWSYDNAAAKTYFTNAWDGNAPPSPTCTGPGCAPGNTTWIPNYCPTPSAPGAPAALANKLNPVVGQNACTFFDGGMLSGDTYTQDVTVDGSCNVCQPCSGSGGGCGTSTACPTISGQKYKAASVNANFKFTYTYNITPTTNPVAARTAWNLDSSNNSPAHVEVSADVASQSTLRKGANDCTATTCSPGSTWKFKASHTIIDASGLRVTGMKVGVYDSNNMLVGTEKVQGTDFTLSLGTADYFYAQNAGVFGDPTQLLNNALVSDIQQGDVCTAGGNRDDQCGNDAVPGEKAVMNAPVGFDIATEGNYTLRVGGTVKGNAGTLDQPFSVCSSLTINAGSCSTATNNCQ